MQFTSVCYDILLPQMRIEDALNKAKFSATTSRTLGLPVVGLMESDVNSVLVHGYLSAQKPPEAFTQLR
jgi:hypothetical protein